MEPEAADGVDFMSKAEILRVIIAERLSTAAQEIFAVVERTLAGYEEEVSGCRQEIDLRRNQLGVLLQPRVKLERVDDEYTIPISEPIPEKASEGGDGGDGDVVGGRDEDGLLAEEQQQQKFEMSVEDDGSMALLCYTGVETHDEEEGEEEELVPTPTEDQDQISELDYEEASRSSPPTVQSDRRSVGRPRAGDLHRHVDLKICILDNSGIKILSPRVFQTCPIQELRCPCGLQEADFLVLLRSTFPQLAANKPFEIFWSDRSRLLKPLEVETLTPEEICSTIKSNGGGKSSLYIRLKTQSVSTTPPPSAANSPANYVDLRVCILDDPKIKVILPLAFRKWPLQELKCPRGLQEAGFLDLLRSSFPQLAGDKPFDVFTIDRNRTLRPLMVETLTPEKIAKTIKSIGAGKSALYIRLKRFDKEMKLIRPLQRKDAAAENAHTGLNTRTQSDRRRPGRPRTSDPQSYVDLSLRLLEDPQVNVLSARVFRKYPLQELKCPCGLQEPDFLNLLRSTFPQLAGDKPFDILTSDRSRVLYPLRMKNLTPEGVCKTMRSLKHSGIYIRLKAPEKKPNTAAAKDSPSTSDSGRRRRTGPDSLFSSSASDKRGKYMEEADDEDHEWLESPSLWALPLSETDQDEEEVDDNWKPAKTDLRDKKPEKRKRQKIEHSGVQTKRKRIRSSLQVLTGRKYNGPLPCRVCGIMRRSIRMLIKHSWRHVDDAGRLCGVCGEQSMSAELLRIHLQSHQKTHRCNICGKSLLSMSGLSGHLARHRGEKPHKCKICHKAFAEKWTLNNHMWTHVKDKPHKCDICQMSYMSKLKLKLHRVKHMEENPYSCSTCHTSYSTFQTLAKHMSTHSSSSVSSREKPYACDICSKRYSLNTRLQSHLRKHTSQWPNGCSTCNKQFTCKAKLVTHMKNHT